MRIADLDIQKVYEDLYNKMNWLCIQFDYRMILPQLRRWLSHAKHYSDILPAHISAILKEDERSGAHRYGHCKQYIDRIIASN
jgi:hypothetical protein